ncbi:MAG: family 20 glycosylhydrolase [Victivallaceae bacterium]|nr:family 20 glycosylhydrolase [Victivallaceae bacterium]
MTCKNIAEELCKANWLHLDMKGTVPAVNNLLAWLDWFADRGFNGIVFEYEDRIEWKSWPGLHRPGYGRDELKKIHDACRERQLEIVPLIQGHGHLEWLLKHEKYSFLRENGNLNELCPSHPQSAEMIRNFIDECLALHPDSRYIHLGADETWYLGSCARCSEKAAGDPRGKLGLYLDHLVPLCEHVESKGRIPIIWGDMFYREERMELCRYLPEKTVIVDWQYYGSGPFDNITELLSKGRVCMGASAISCGSKEQYFTVQKRIQPRIENVLAWHKWKEKNGIGIIHTAWNRAGSLLPIYGLWHGQVPAFIAAGRPAAWENGSWRDYFMEMDIAMQRNLYSGNCSLTDFIEKNPLAINHEKDPFMRESLRWYSIALQYQKLFNQIIFAFFGHECVRITNRYIGNGRADLKNTFVELSAELESELDKLELSARKFWEEHSYSDGDEFFASRVTALRELLSLNY